MRFRRQVFYVLSACLLAIPVARAQTSSSTQDIARYFKEGEWLSLLRASEVTIAAQPDKPQGYIQRGDAKFHLLDPEGAIPDLNRAALQLPRVGALWFELGNAYLEVRQYDKAVEAFKTGTVNDPENDVNWRGLWDAYDRMGNDEGARGVREYLTSRKSPYLPWGDAFTKGSELWKPAQHESNSASSSVSSTTVLTGADSATGTTIDQGTAAWEQGQLDHAIEILEPVVKRLSKELGRFHPDTLRASDVLVIALGEKMQPEKALAYLAPSRRLDSAIELARINLERRRKAHGLDSEQAIRAQLILTYFEFDNGDVRHAVPDAMSVRDRASRVLGPDSSSSIWSEWLFCGALLMRGQAKETVSYGTNLLKRVTPILGENSFTLIPIQQSIGLAYESMHRHREALSHIEAALSIARQSLPEDHRGYILTMGMSVSALALAGNLKEAELRQQELLSIIERHYGADSPEEMAALTQSAISSLVSGRFSDTTAFSQRALRWYEQRLAPDSTYIFADTLLLYAGYYRQGYTGASYRVFHELAPLLEDQFRRIDPGDTAGVQRFASVSLLYKIYASQTIYRDPVEAFEVAELSKARTLLESSALSIAAREGLLSAADQAQLDKLRAAFNATESYLAGAPTASAEHNHFEVERQRLQGSLNALVSDLKEKYPKYRQATEVRSLKAKEALAVLDEDTAFLSYLIVDKDVYGFGLSRNHGLEAQWLGSIDDLDKKIGLVRSNLNPEFADDSRFLYDSAELKELSSLLIGKFAKTIAGKKKIIVSPDGPLAFLPFEILSSEGQPLVKQYDIAYAPSLSVYALMKAREAEYAALKRKELFSMGGATYTIAGKDKGARGRGPRPADDDAVTHRAEAFLQVRASATISGTDGVQSAFQKMDFSWENLPGTEAEVKALAHLFPANQVLTETGDNASEANLKRLNEKGLLSGYKYLHFATHGYFNPEEPALSAIVLKQVGNPPGVDGFITAAKWPSYNLKSDLIVMSACETGEGKFVQGSGVTGLPYSLYVAGNTNLVLTLWQVADNATKEFMVSFFSRLKAGESKSAALADTKRQFLADKRFAHPAFWAGIVYYGE